MKEALARDRLVPEGRFALWAGPCAVESPERFQAAAEFVKSRGASALRGGIFKPRTDPKSFQGLGAAALPFVKQIKEAVRLPFVTEVTDPRQTEILDDVADIYQAGARNMFNYELLKELGGAGKPVLLKRGFAASVKEWLSAADYLVRYGMKSDQIILCERGIRSFETVCRNTLDMNAVAYVKKHTDFAVFADPSHGCGRPELIPALSKAAVAVGADGLLVEVHGDPESALCDGDQALDFEGFAGLVKQLEPIAAAVGKTL